MRKECGNAVLNAGLKFWVCVRLVAEGHGQKQKNLPEETAE